VIDPGPEAEAIDLNEITQIELPLRRSGSFKVTDFSTKGKLMPLRLSVTQ